MLQSLRRLVLMSSLIALTSPIASERVANADPTHGTWHRDSKDPHWVQGQVTVDATPDDVFARAQRVDTWPTFLTDIKRIKVNSHRDSHWKIDLETRTLAYGMLGYDVDIGPGRTMKLYTNSMGVRAVAQTDVSPGPTPQQSIVTYSFYIALSGLPSIVMSESEIRAKQEHMVTVMLDDFYRTFHQGN